MATEGGGPGWFAVYRQPRVAAMLFLGFSAGLPFLLVFQTLTAWLAQAGIQRGTIGLISLIGLTYSLKFFWAPVVDRAPLPVLTRALGRRRAWMLLAQLGLVAGLAGMALGDPASNLQAVILCALAVAFASATQDITIDAWRIESARLEDQGAMAASYQLGYRFGLIAAGTGALLIAGESGWRAAYLTMAALAGLGVMTTLLIPEPPERAAPPRGNWLRTAVVQPFTDFFTRNGLATGALILAFVGTFRLTDITMGVMANPFYLAIGYTLQQIGLVAKGYGVVLSIVGAFAGGAAVARFGSVRSLMAGGLLVIASNLTFAALALMDAPGLGGLALVISADNFAAGFAGTAFIAYLSGLTNTAYTATQYALFSSLFTLPGKLLASQSGFVAEAAGWPLFFAYTSALGIPALVLLALLTRRLREPSSGGASPART